MNSILRDVMDGVRSFNINLFGNLKGKDSNNGKNFYLY